MNIALILVVAAVLFLIVMVGMAIMRRRRVSRAFMHEQIQPLDIEAFRNLIDPREHEYLCRHLSRREFRRVQRKRLRAASAYVRVAGQNAAILIRVSQFALGCADAESLKAARQLLDEALLLRRNAIFALLRIRIALLWPNGPFQGGSILERYRSVDRTAMLLARLQNPAATLRVSAS
jgi:hypothetical protein